MDLAEDSGLGPPAQSAPARLPRAEAQLRRKLLPGDTGEQHEQDALQTQPVVHRPRTRGPFRPGWEHRLNQRPQLVVDHPRCTHTTTNGRIVISDTAHQPAPTRSCYELIIILRAHRYGVYARCVRRGCVGRSCGSRWRSGSRRVWCGVVRWRVSVVPKLVV